MEEGLLCRYELYLSNPRSQANSFSSFRKESCFFFASLKVNGYIGRYFLWSGREVRQLF